MRKNRIQRILSKSPIDLWQGFRSGLQRFVGAEPILVIRDYSDMVGPAEQASGLTFPDVGDETKNDALVSVYEKHLFVNSCVYYIASRMPKGELLFAKRGSDRQDIIDDHPVVNAFRYFNPYQSEREAWEYLASFLMLCGSAHLFTTQRSPGSPRDIAFEMYPLMSQGVRTIKSREGIVGYEYVAGGMTQRIIPQDLWTTRCFNPRDRFLGMGRLEAGAVEISTDLSARKWNKQLLDKGVHVAGILESEEELSEEVAEKARKTFEKKYAGSATGKQIVAMWGGLKFKPMTLAHKDIAWIEQLGMGREDIATAFNLPLEVLGMKAANFATLVQKNKIAWETIVSWGDRFVDSLNSNFLPHHAPELEAFWDYSSIDALQPDRGDMIKSGQAAIASGQYTPNEWREKMLGLEPIPGGDVLLIGRGLIPIDQIGADAGTQPPAPGKVAKIDPGEEEFLRIWNAAHGRMTQDVSAILKKHVGKLEKHLLRRIGEGVDANVLHDMRRIWLVEGNDLTRARTATSMKKHIRRWGSVYLEHAQLESTFNLPIDREIRIIASRTNEIMRSEGRQWLKIRGAMIEAMSQTNVDQRSISLAVSKVLGSHVKLLPHQIVQTNITSALNEASNELQAEATRRGIDLEHEWSTNLDGNERPWHDEANGQRINPSREKYIVHGEALRFPGDPAGSADNVIGCRCGQRPKRVKTK